MMKKSSKMTPSQLQENTVVEEEKPSLAPKKAISEIDEIFAGKKGKKSELENTEKPDDVTKRTDKTKKKKKTPSQLQENTVVEEEKPSLAPKRAISEIDEIFAGKKRKKSELEKTGKSDDVTKRTNKTKKKKKKKIKGPDDGEFVDPPSRPRNKTEEGLSIYTEEELGINKADAGGTPLCPFDCSCCF